MRAQDRLSLLQWNAGGARRRPTQVLTGTCGPHHAILLQEAHDHVPHVPAQYHNTDGGELAILLNSGILAELPQHS